MDANEPTLDWKTHPLNIWLIKWILFPAITLFLFWQVGSYFYNVQRCRWLAAEHGYLESLYLPRRRFDPRASECQCRKKTNPDGTIDETAELIIPMR